MKKTLIACLVALMVAGCIVKETRHTLYLEPDGSLTWTVVEEQVRSDADTAEDREREESEYLALVAGDYPVAAALSSLRGFDVRTNLVRERRPYLVVTEAGFDSVEHCTMIDDDGLSLMKRKGTYCVPTLYCLDYLQIPENPMNLDPSIVEKAKAMRGFQRDRFAKIVRAEVPVAYGTDIGVFPHGENWKDFPCMIECGMSTEEAIRSATINSATMNGIQDSVGLLKNGFKADVIAVKGNPLNDITALSQVCFVMRDGVVYRHDA